MLDALEKTAKIISLVAIPVALWWLGTQYQSANTKAKTAVEYVKLSISGIMEKEALTILRGDPNIDLGHDKNCNHIAKLKHR